MEDSEFYKYHNEDLWHIMGEAAMAKAAEILLISMQSTLTKEFNDLLDSGNYKKAQEVETEAFNRLVDIMKKVVVDAIPIAGAMHKMIFGRYDKDFDVPVDFK